MTSPKCFPAKRKKAQYAQWWGDCAWKNSYGSVEAAAWGVRRGILKTDVNTVYSIPCGLSIPYIGIGTFISVVNRPQHIEDVQFGWKLARLYQVTEEHRGLEYPDPTDSP